MCVFQMEKQTHDVREVERRELCAVAALGRIASGQGGGREELVETNSSIGQAGPGVSVSTCQTTAVLLAGGPGGELLAALGAPMGERETAETNSSIGQVGPGVSASTCHDAAVVLAGGRGGELTPKTYLRQFTKLDKAKQMRAVGEKIFSREIPGSNGKRTFCCATYDDFWRKYQTLNIKNYYEVIEDKPSKLYFDLGNDLIYYLFYFLLFRFINM